ncbi:MAG: DUF2073 domain-containing protein [Candidatus Nanoarchaeia archaeon]|nr:DUF2073 domain-containing protein [Candidatus Nanoarchaeia archaeon]
MNLTFKFVPFNELNGLTSEKKINRLLEFVKKDKIVLLQGRLKPSEEAWLIQKTMEQQAANKGFKGIELFTIPASRNEKIFSQMRAVVARVLLGSRDELTLIGPGTIIKEIKSNPDRSELLTTVRG